MTPTKKKLIALEKEKELILTLGNRDKFFKFYFKELGEKVGEKPKHKTNCAAFEYVNELYTSYFGESRYSNFDSFRRACNHYYKNNKK